MTNHTTRYRHRTLCSFKAILPILFVSLLSFSTAEAQGIAPGGCVTGGGGSQPLDQSSFNSNSFNSGNFGPLNARNAVASAQTQRLRAAFQKVGSEMDQSLSDGDLVSGFRQYLTYANRAQQYRKALPEISSEFLTTRNRITVVLNYAVNNAKRVTEKSPEDPTSLMTLVEVANMPELAAPCLNAQQFLEGVNDTEAYKKTLAEFKAKHQIKSLAPESHTDASMGEIPGVTKTAQRKKN